MFQSVLSFRRQNNNEEPTISGRLLCHQSNLSCSSDEGGLLWCNLSGVLQGYLALGMAVCYGEVIDGDI